MATLTRWLRPGMNAHANFDTSTAKPGSTNGAGGEAAACSPAPLPLPHHLPASAAHPPASAAASAAAASCSAARAAAASAASRTHGTPPLRAVRRSDSATMRPPCANAGTKGPTPLPASQMRSARRTSAVAGSSLAPSAAPLPPAAPAAASRSSRTRARRAAAAPRWRWPPARGGIWRTLCEEAVVKCGAQAAAAACCCCLVGAAATVAATALSETRNRDPALTALPRRLTCFYYVMLLN